jgi:hypothetical protein
MATTACPAGFAPVIERLAWVTTEDARGRDDDEPLAVAALRHGGLDVVPVYPRVDLVRGGPDDYQVLEVEVIEPSLFLPQAEPAAVRRLVDALGVR